MTVVSLNQCDQCKKVDTPSALHSAGSMRLCVPCIHAFLQAAHETGYHPDDLLLVEVMNGIMLVQSRITASKMTSCQLLTLGRDWVKGDVGKNFDATVQSDLEG